MFIIQPVIGTHHRACNLYDRCPTIVQSALYPKPTTLQLLEAHPLLLYTANNLAAKVIDREVFPAIAIFKFPFGLEHSGRDAESHGGVDVTCRVHGFRGWCETFVVLGTRKLSARSIDTASRLFPLCP